MEGRGPFKERGGGGGNLMKMPYAKGCSEPLVDLPGITQPLTLWVSYKELLDYTHSKAQNFKEEWEGKRMQNSG